MASVINALRPLKTRRGTDAAADQLPPQRLDRADARLAVAVKVRRSASAALGWLVLAERCRAVTADAGILHLPTIARLPHARCPGKNCGLSTPARKGKVRRETDRWNSDKHALVCHSDPPESRDFRVRSGLNLKEKGLARKNGKRNRYQDTLKFARRSYR